MAILKRIQKTLSDYTVVGKLQLILLLLFVCTLTLNTRVNSSLLGLLLFSFLFTFRIADFIQHKKYILWFTAGYLYSLLSLGFTENFHEGKLVLERQLALFFLPVLFFSSFKITQKAFDLINKVFFWSVVCVCIYLLKCSAENFVASGLPMQKWFVKDNLYHSFALPIKMHATYLSLYVALAIFFGFYEFLSNDKWWHKMLFFFSTILLVLTIALLSSRVVVTSLVFIIFFVYPFFTWRRKYKFLLVLAAVAMLFTFLFVIMESSFITNRFVDKMDDEIKMTSFLKADTTYNPIYGGETRADRWYCAIELIKEKPLIGYGTGSEKEELMKKYKKYNLQNAIVNNYDSHNQYLAYGIKGGVFGLVFFLIAVFYSICIAMKNKSFIYLSFILLFAISCLTEDVLESNKGIFFFAFFNSFFVSYTLGVNNQKKLNSYKLQ